MITPIALTGAPACLPRPAFGEAPHMRGRGPAGTYREPLTRPFTKSWADKINILIYYSINLLIK